MKVERKEKEFDPIHIILESKEELDLLLYLIRQISEKSNILDKVDSEEKLKTINKCDKLLTEIYDNLEDL